MQEATYDDNVDLSADDTVSAFSSDSSFGLTGGARSPTLLVELASLFNFTRYPSQSQLDSDDQFVDLTTAWTGERLSTSVVGQFVRDTTRTSDVDDTGRFIGDNIRREFFAIGPEVTYQLSPLDALTVSGSYSETHFDGNELTDFETVGVGLGWDRALTPRTDLLANASASKVNSNDQGSDNSRYYSLLVGGAHQFSENFRARLTVGPAIADSDRVGNGNSDRSTEKGIDAGLSFDAGVTYAIEERLTFEGILTRGFAPGSSTGALSGDTSLGIAASYQLFPNVYLDTPITVLHREAIDDQGSDNRDFASLEPTLRWRIDPDWDFSMGYRLRWQDSDDGEALGNSVIATLTYRLPRLAMSR